MCSPCHQYRFKTTARGAIDFLFFLQRGWPLGTQSNALAIDGAGWIANLMDNGGNHRTLHKMTLKEVVRLRVWDSVCECSRADERA